MKQERSALRISTGATRPTVAVAAAEAGAATEAARRTARHASPASPYALYCCRACGSDWFSRVLVWFWYGSGWLRARFFPFLPFPPDPPLIIRAAIEKQSATTTTATCMATCKSWTRRPPLPRRPSASPRRRPARGPPEAALFVLSPLSGFWLSPPWSGDLPSPLDALSLSLVGLLPQSQSPAPALP